jgi:hypothetical protein
VRGDKARGTPATKCAPASPKKVARKMQTRKEPLAEETEWWDVVLLLRHEFEPALKTMRKWTTHPDAVWFSSLVPPDATEERLVEIMREQGDDPRALYFVWLLADGEPRCVLERAAEKGFAPAQTMMSLCCAAESSLDRDKAFFWAEAAANQGDRSGILRLAQCLHKGVGCERDDARAIELYRVAAQVGDPCAMRSYGKLGFGQFDWERYTWYGRAATHGVVRPLFAALADLVPLFELGQHGRVLHTVAVFVRGNFDVKGQEAFGVGADDDILQHCSRIVELHDAMLHRARRALACWSVVALRLGMAKDMRVLIAKMAGEEPWLWL